MLGNGQRVGELFGGMRLQFFRDRHVLRALEHLRVQDVGNDCLIFARQVVVQEINQFGACRLFAHQSAS